MVCAEVQRYNRQFQIHCLGVGAKKYPVEWWSPLLKKFLSKHKLDELIPLPAFGRWVREAKGEGKGGGLGLG